MWTFNDLNFVDSNSGHATLNSEVFSFGTVRENSDNR